MTPTATQLNTRRRTILELIVGDYIRTAVPVASQQIVREHDLHVSPATIRNDMAELEELGYISRPHSSAGGVPADTAYRFYVERAAGRARPERPFETSVKDRIIADEGDPEGWARTAATVLSQAVHNVAITTAPRVFHARLRQLHLVHLQGRQALLVLVMQEAQVRRHLVQLEAPATQESLNELSARLSEQLSGKTADEVRQTQRTGALTGGPEAVPVAVEVERLLAQAEGSEPVRPYTDGLRHMLDQPEFSDGGRAREAAALMEDDTALQQILTDGPKLGQVQVIIGGENRFRRLRPYSVILAQYGVPGQVTGIICAIGPTRMDYVRAVASVRHMAGFLSTLLSTLNEAAP